MYYIYLCTSTRFFLSFYTSLYYKLSHTFWHLCRNFKLLDSPRAAWTLGRAPCAPITAHTPFCMCNAPYVVFFLYLFYLLFFLFLLAWFSHLIWLLISNRQFEIVLWCEFLAKMRWLLHTYAYVYTYLCMFVWTHILIWRCCIIFLWTCVLKLRLFWRILFKHFTYVYVVTFYIIHIFLWCMTSDSLCI